MILWLFVTPETMQDLDLDSLCIVARDNSVGSESNEWKRFQRCLVSVRLNDLMGGT